MLLKSVTVYGRMFVIAIALTSGNLSVWASPQEDDTSDAQTEVDSQAEVDPGRIVDFKPEDTSVLDTKAKEEKKKPIVSIKISKPEPEIKSESVVPVASAVTQLSDLEWLSPLLILLIALLILWSLLELMTRYLRHGSQKSAAASTKRVGQTETEFGRAFLNRPSRVDDLTRLGGIDSKAEQRLNALGIYQFDQLKSMTPGQRAVLERKSGLSKLKPESISEFGSPTAFSTVETVRDDAPSSPAAGPSSAITASAIAASTAAVSSAAASAQLASSSPKLASTNSSANGSSFPPPPHFNRKNNLAEVGVRSNAPTIADTAQVSKEKISVSPESLESNSISNTAADQQVQNLKGQGTLHSNSEGNGTTSASNKYSETERSPVASKDHGEVNEKAKHDFADKFENLYTSPPSDPDDLTRLAGIDAAAAARLNAAGIYQFEQLANLDENQEALLADRVGLDENDFADWRRCMYAWGRGIDTSANLDAVHEPGMLHGVSLPQIADGVFDGERLIAYPEQVIFRGSNPEGWGRGVDDEIEGVATSLGCDAIRSDINYIRIRRTDTRESVVLPMTKGQLFVNGNQSQNGWNGSSEVFFGGRHIGAFAKQLPQEVETKFGNGGWGFGHRYDHNDRQEWGWAGRVIQPTMFEISVGCAGEVPGTVVFRSSDPAIWNTRNRDGDFRMANPISSVSHPVNFVRIMRHATGEAVIVRVDGNHLLDEGFDPLCGWNGSGSEFSGGLHLGVYHSDLPQDFETRFEFGGWGFGHPYNDNDRQAWGWAGRQLPETVFEISLLEFVPDFMAHEIVE